MITQLVAPPAARLLTGSVGRAGGVVVIDGLPGEEHLAQLRAEAMAQFPGADRQDVDHEDRSTGRGGVPARHLATTGGGPAQDAFYSAPWLSDYLSMLCGTTVTPSGSRGSYSYYTEPGDHLGLHLDIETCDVTLISVLQDESGDHGSSGSLVVHPAHLGEDLDAVRRSPTDGVGLVSASPGQSIVLLGGLLPHQTLPVAAGCPRVISALCFIAS